MPRPLAHATVGVAGAESESPSRSLSKRRRSSSRVFSAWTIVMFTGAFVLLFVVFYIVPICYALVQSLFKLEREDTFSAPTAVFAGLEQYVTVFTDPSFWGSMARILLLLVTMVPLTIALGLVFALLIDSPLVRGHRFFRLAFFAPYAVPGVIAAIMWAYFYAPTLSPLPDAAAFLNLLTSPGVFYGLVNIVVWGVAGFNMLILYSALKAIPRDIYEAAKIDGASQLRIAFSIKIPLIAPSIIMTLVLSTIGTFQLFNEPTVLKNISKAIGPDFTPNMLVYSTANIPNYNLAAAYSVVLALLTCAVSFLILRSVQRRAFA